MVFGHRFGGWSMNVTAWHEREARTAVVRFEDLIQDPMGQAAAALAELDLSLEEPMRCVCSVTAEGCAV